MSANRRSSAMRGCRGRLGVCMAMVCLWMTLFSQPAEAIVTYEYTGNHFNEFSDPSSYTTSNFVRATLTFDQPLAANLYLQDVTGYPGFTLSISDGLQTLTAPSALQGLEILISTDSVGQIIAPWSLIRNCCLFPNNGIAALNSPGGRGVADSGNLSAPTNQFPNTPGNLGIVRNSPGTWADGGPVNPVIGTVTDVFGEVTANGTPLKKGDPVRQHDIIQTSSTGAVSLRFPDGTTIALSEGTRFVLDEYAFDPDTKKGNLFFSYLTGFFVYISGLIGKEDPDNIQIDTPVGQLGIRGTEFIARYPYTAGGITGVRVDLLEGILAIAPKDTQTVTSFLGPVTIMTDASQVTPSGLTQAGYEAIKAQFFLYPNLINLVKLYVAKPDVEANMVATLQEAQKAAAGGKVKLANNLINTFINQVSAQAKKSLTAEQAATLIQLARELMT